jgi:hypothetical protein
MSDFLDVRYEKDPSIVHREIAGEAILVPIRRNVADLSSIYTLDEVGASVWGLIGERRTVGEIIAAVLDEYEADADTVQKDVIEFVQHLEEIGAIRAT